MGVRFRKSIKIAPGVRLNLGKKSAGISIGGKYGGVSFNSKTGARARVSAPGTGFSYSTKISGKKTAPKTGAKTNSSSETVSVPQQSTRRPLTWQRGLIGFLLLLNALPFSYAPLIGLFFIIAGLWVLRGPKIEIEKKGSTEPSSPAPKEAKFEFSVAGLSSKNSDGIPRQEVLRRLCKGFAIKLADAWLELHEEDFAETIQIISDEGCVGAVATKDVEKIKKLWDIGVNAIFLLIETSEKQEKVSAVNESVYIVYEAKLIIYAKNNAGDPTVTENDYYEEHLEAPLDVTPQTNNTADSESVEEPKERIEHYFKVAGVTFRNPDGTSRQKILKEICMDDDFGIEDAYLEEYKYKGEDAIRVLTSYGCVGNIKQDDIEEVKPLFDIEVERCYIDIDSFENEDDKKIYYAELVIVPAQQEEVLN